MSKSTVANKKNIKSAAPVVLEVGTQVTFKGYPAGESGDLEEGETYFILAWWPEHGVYDLAKTAKSKKAVDSAAPAEIEPFETAAPAAKAASKKKPKAAVIEEEEEEDEGPMVVVDNEEAEEEEEAPAKASKKKTAEPVEPAKPVKQLPSVKDALASANGNAITAADNLHSTVEQTYLTLGGVLSVIQATDAHADPGVVSVGEEAFAEGQKGFAKYVERRLGMKYRKAQYLIGIYGTVTRLGITEAKLKGIGWSKLKDLVSYLDSGANVEEALDLARKLTGAQLTDEIKRRMVKDGVKLHGNSTASHEMVSFSFTVHNDQADTVTEALRLAAEKQGLADPNVDPSTLGASFIHIINEWYSLQD
jgi:hypothetical protein